MTHRVGSRLLAALVCAAVAAGVILSGGCGIAADEAPRPLAADDVPYELLEQATTSTSTSTSLPVATVEVPVYFVRSGERRLVQVTRKVTRDATVNKVLEQLLEGPTELERESGVRSAIDPNAESGDFEVRRPEGGVVTIDLDSSFVEAIPQADQTLAFGQLVCTATGIQEVTGVQFTLNGEARQVPLPDGTAATGAVGCGAFEALINPPPPTTSPPPPPAPTDQQPPPG